MIVQKQKETWNGERAYIRRMLARLIKSTPLLAAVVLAASVTHLCAQTVTVLHTFKGASDGNGVLSDLLLSNDTLYGTTQGGGTNGTGTVFSVKTDGSNFRVIHTISSPEEAVNPSSLIMSGDTLFGTAQQAGPHYLGTVFSVGASNGILNTLHFFDGTNGFAPSAGLVLGGDTLYGTTMDGGSNNMGTVFSIKTNGSNFTVLYHFSAFGPGSTNADGCGMKSSLLLVGNVLYGTAHSCGPTNAGTVFALNAGGGGFRVLHQFLGGADGIHPAAGLALSGSTLYGTTESGGTNGTGTIFSVNTNGSDFAIIHPFAAVSISGRNAEGSWPEAGLVISGDMLFGTASSGGANDYGTIFMLKTNASGFTRLHDFTIAGLEGHNPASALTLAGSVLYGAAYLGGTNGDGTLFRLTVQPGISSVSLAGTNLTISATNGLAGRGYTVLMTTNAALPKGQWVPLRTNVLSSSGNFVITVTNAVSRSVPIRFYSLSVQ